MTPDARARLRSYPWPGNVRELQNAIERAAILADGSEIDTNALQLPSPKPTPEELPDGMLEDQFLWDGPLDEVAQRAVAHVERFKIQNALRESSGTKRAPPKSSASPTKPSSPKSAPSAS